MEHVRIDGMWFASRDGGVSMAEMFSQNLSNTLSPSHEREGC